MTTVPFPKNLPKKLCENPNCVQGEGGKPNEFQPTTTWEKYCSPYCRNQRYHYDKIKPRRQSAAQIRRAAKAKPEQDALRAGEETPTVEHPEAPPPPGPV